MHALFSESVDDLKHLAKLLDPTSEGLVQYAQFLYPVHSEPDADGEVLFVCDCVSPAVICGARAAFRDVLK